MPPRARHRTSLDPSDLYVLAPFQGLTITRKLQPNGLHPFRGNAHQTDDRHPRSPFGKPASVDQTEARKASRLSTRTSVASVRSSPKTSIVVHTGEGEQGQRRERSCNPKTRSSAWQWGKEGKEEGGNVLAWRKHCWPVI